VTETTRHPRHASAGGGDRPGREVSASQDGRDYLAWVPAPLPPEIHWDGTLANILAQAGHSLGELAGIGRNLPNPHLLISPFLRKEAVLSSRIEGTQATIADVYAYEARNLSSPMRHRDHGITVSLASPWAG
jgi:hypothetical protein